MPGGGLEIFVRRPAGQMIEHPERLLHGNVAFRQNIGPQQAFRQVNVRRPVADPLEAFHVGADGFIGQRNEAVKIENPRHDRFRKRARVGDFLPAETEFAQCRIAETEKRFGRDGSQTLLQTLKSGIGGSQRHLLLEDDMHQRGKPGHARPQWRIAVALEHQSQRFVPVCQPMCSLFEVYFVEFDYHCHRQNKQGISGFPKNIFTVKIVTLTLNPALDKSASVERLVPEQKLRCSRPQIDAGGGGINVSKGIRKLGGDSTAVFPAGGSTGHLLQSILKDAGIETRVHALPGETRENFSVTETATNLQYRFTMPGLEMAEQDADACLDMVERLQPEYLVASGSLPPGLPVTYYVKVAALAKRIKARLILDTSGAALRAAADEGVYLLKPNLAELSALAGVKKLEMNQVDDAALEIIRLGKCEVVVVSLGARGALLVTREGFEHVPSPTVPKLSTVGAGDSMVAGMVWALSEGKTHREMVHTGVACGTAATMNPGTELFHADDVGRLLEWLRQYGERYRFREF